MKVICEPKVTVVGHTVFVPHPDYEVPPDGTDFERLGAFAAKGCYDSYGATGRSCTENQRTIVQHRHGSVTEHLNLTFFIEGITRGLSLELNRHRPFAISQRSTRYTAEEDAAIVLEPYYADIYKRRLTKPESIRDVQERAALNMFLDSCADSLDSYERQVNRLMELNPHALTGFDLRKWARGKARSLLPHALETRGTWTMNIRTLRYFLESRSDLHAEEEIRRLAWYIYLAAKAFGPVYFEDYSLKYYDVSPYPVFETEHRKI